jgi:hypothetical protein
MLMATVQLKPEYFFLKDGRPVRYPPAASQQWRNQFFSCISVDLILLDSNCHLGANLHLELTSMWRATAVARQKQSQSNSNS